MKCLFILPYFGKLNNYFQLFLNSCKNKENFDFLIITDDKSNFSYPDNVNVKYTSFPDFIDYINQKIPCEVNIPHPMKLCDFRGTYGYLFEDEIKDYGYWGYIDNDIIIGDIDNMVTPLMEKNHDKIFNLGHMTLIKNNYDNNHLFMRTINREENYSYIFSEGKNLKFDEENHKNSISQLFENSKKSIYYDQFGADIYTKSSKFYINHYNFSSNYHNVIKRPNLFIYDNGHIYSYSKVNSLIEEKEYAYIHLQKRKMEIKIPINISKYKIIPNAFKSIETTGSFTERVNFDKEKKYIPNLHYFKIRSSNLKKKITIFIENR